VFSPITHRSLEYTADSTATLEQDSNKYYRRVLVSNLM